MRITPIFGAKIRNVNTKVRTHFLMAGVLSDVLHETVPFISVMGYLLDTADAMLANQQCSEALHFGTFGT